MSPTSFPERDYVAAVICAYLALPDTPSPARTADRTLAHSLFSQTVPLEVVRAAFLIASARRALRPPDSPPLGLVRSLHYFLPVIEELRIALPDPAYLTYVAAKLASSRARPS